MNSQIIISGDSSLSPDRLENSHLVQYLGKFQLTIQDCLVIHRKKWVSLCHLRILPVHRHPSLCTQRQCLYQILEIKPKDASKWGTMRWCEQWLNWGCQQVLQDRSASRNITQGTQRDQTCQQDQVRGIRQLSSFLLPLAHLIPGVEHLLATPSEVGRTQGQSHVLPPKSLIPAHLHVFPLNLCCLVSQRPSGLQEKHLPEISLLLNNP